MATLKQKLAVKEIKLNPSNPRLIKDDKFKKLVQSLKDFPEMLDAREIVVNKDNVILGGNMRFRAAKEAGLTEVPVKIVDWPEDKQREFVIKDNVSGGEWDWDILANEWGELPLDDWGLDLPATFGDQEIEEDEPPEVSSEPPLSRFGEIYQLGKHRLMCGDSTDFGALSDLMNGATADMIFTDPPYNVAYEGKTADALTIQNDSMSDAEFYKFLLNVHQNLAEVTKPGGSIYVCHADSEGLNFRKALIESGFLLKQCLIWVKQTMVMGRQDYHWQHEPILYGWKDGSSHYFVDDRTQTTIWNIDRPSRNAEHPTMKPVALCARAIKNSSLQGQIVVDVFGGSGSTLIACEQTNRICYGMEIDPKYVDVIRKRYWKFVNNNDETGWEENTPVVN
jgi:DNA modification methylase